MISAKIVGYTQPSEEFKDQFRDVSDLVAFCARVSNPSNQFNNETAGRLIAYLMKHKHWSPFEMASVTMEIECTRDIARQLLRHRSFSFQEFCIAGDSVVSTSDGKIQIQDLYKQQFEKSLPSVKMYDEKTKEFVYSQIKEVFDTGVKQCYTLTLSNGRRIQATADHKFLTKEGFKTLRDLQIGDMVGCNGVESYRNKEWLATSKQESLTQGGLSYIAEKAGVTVHTIRKWLKIHGLQFSKKEVAMYTPAWNKGLPRDEQPRFNATLSEETRSKMSKSSRRGSQSNLWRGGVERGARLKIADWQNKYRNFIFKKYDNCCANCKSDVDLQIDHILPVKAYPEHAYDLENLQVLCYSCHKEKTRKEFSTSPNYYKVIKIEECGLLQTYDLEVAGDSHNYVANGIVTHNSQRYADPTKDLKFVTREARLQDQKNRQNSLDVQDKELQDLWEEQQRKVIKAATEAYAWAVSNGIAKEQARAVLPEGNTMSRLYVQGTIRSWIHYIEVRSEEGTQKEHRQLALECAKAVKTIFDLKST